MLILSILFGGSFLTNQKNLKQIEADILLT